MHYFLYLSLDRFYVSGCPDDRPLVVHRDKKVLDANRAARRLGVAPGMSLSEARAILADGAAFEAYCPDKYKARRDAWLRRLVPYSDAIEPLDDHAVCLDLDGHADPAYIAQEVLRDLHARFHLPMRAGIAPGVWVARLASAPIDAKALALGVPVVEPVQDARAFLAAQPVGCLQPVSPESRERLDFLGYRLVGSIHNAPAAALKRQFGREGSVILSAASGRLMDHPKAVYPPDSVSRMVRFEGEVGNAQVIADALHGLAADLAAELCQSDKVAGGVTLYALGESGKAYADARSLKRPVQRASELSNRLLAAFGRMEAGEPLLAVKAHLHDLSDADRSQAHLFVSRREGAERRMETAAARLSGSYGEDCIRPASTIELPWREQVLKVWRDATGWR